MANRRQLYTILLIIFTNVLGATIVIPTLPLYARRHFDADPTQITLLVTSYFGAQFLAGPWIGRLSDRYGRVPVLLVSQFGTFLSFIAMGFAGSLWLLFAARVFDGITGGNIIVAQAYITDVTPKERRTESLGYVFGAFGLGFVFGPALGGVFAAWLGESAPFFVGALVSLATFFVTWWALRDVTTAEERAEALSHRRARIGPMEIIQNTPLLLVLLLTLGAQFAFALVQSTFALLGEEVLFAGLPEAQISLFVGLMLTVIGIGQVITQTALLRPLLKIFDEHRLVIGGMALRGIGILLLALFTANPWTMGNLGLLAFAVGSGVMMPSLQSLSTTTAPDEIRGAVLGIYQSAINLGIILGSAIAGRFFAADPLLPYYISAALFMALIVPALLLMRQARRVSKLEPVGAIGD